MIVTEPWGEDCELHVTGGVDRKNGARVISIETESAYIPGMTTTQARELARQLIATADILDRALVAL